MRQRTLLFSLLVFFVAGSLGALDFGATIDNSSGYFTNGSPPFEQSDKLALWFNTHLGSKLLFDAQISGNYQNQPLTGGQYVGLYADLDRLSLTGQFTQIPKGPSLLAFSLGRFLYADPTGDIYRQTLDGARVSFSYPRASVAATVGYTGLTIKPSSSILMSLADVTGISDQSQYFGSPRAIGAVVISAPALFLQQDVTLGALVQQDLRPLFANNRLVAPGTTTLSPNEGGALDTQYFIAQISGPLASSLYWKGSFTLETGRMLSFVTTGSGSQYQYEPILAYLATGGLRYYLPQLLEMAIGLDLAFASGDADFTTYYEGNTQGRATAFVPITQGAVATVFSPQLGNVALGALSVSAKPLRGFKDTRISNLQTILTATPFLRPTDGPVSAAGVVVGNGQLYLGTEIDGQINYRPFSDLGVGISGGLFIPNTAAFTSSAGSLQYGAALEVSLSF